MNREAWCVVLGMDIVLFRLVMCHCRNHYKFPQTETAQQRGNHLLCADGNGSIGCLQTVSQCGQSSCCGLDCRRRSLLHYRSLVLFLQQTKVHAFSVPFLCFGRFGVPHLSCMGHIKGFHLKRRSHENPRTRGRNSDWQAYDNNSSTTLWSPSSINRGGVVRGHYSCD